MTIEEHNSSGSPTLHESIAVKLGLRKLRKCIYFMSLKSTTLNTVCHFQGL